MVEEPNRILIHSLQLYQRRRLLAKQRLQGRQGQTCAGRSGYFRVDAPLLGVADLEAPVKPEHCNECCHGFKMWEQSTGR